MQISKEKRKEYLANISLDANIMQFLQNMKTEDGKDFLLSDRKWLWQILMDVSRKQVILKPAQVGMTVAEFYKMVYMTAVNNYNCIYTLPTDHDARDVVGGKFNRIIMHNPQIKTLTKDRDTIDQKQIGSNLIMFRGTKSEKKAMMMSADLVIIDELDASEQSVVEQYSTRTQASQYRGEWKFSHPSLCNFGVDKFWAISDQKHWFIECPKCKRKQFLSFPESICMKRRVYQCKSCYSVLSDKDRADGVWVPKIKKAQYSGYWVNAMMCEWFSAERVLEYYEEKTPEYFYNKVLGLPYSGGNKKFIREWLYNINTQEQADLSGDIFVGVDTGLRQSVAVGNNTGIFYTSVTDNYDDFERIMRLYPNAKAVFDGGGDLVKPRELAEKYAGRIVFCYFKNIVEGTLVKERKNSDSIYIARNNMIDHIATEMQLKRITLHLSREQMRELWRHYSNIYKEETEDGNGRNVARWKRSGDDHLVMAMVYWRGAVELYGYNNLSEDNKEELGYTGDFIISEL